MSEDLIKLSPAMADPGSVSGKDFKVAVPKAGEAGGANELVKLSKSQESPRDVDGKDFPVSVNKGESSDAAGKVSSTYTLDLKSGQLSPDVYKTKK
jgi:hypothetical protein